MRTWIIAAAVVTLLVLGGLAWSWLKPNPDVGDRTKLERTFNADEQHRLDTVTVPRADLAAATCDDTPRCWVVVQGVVYDMSGFPSWMKHGRHHGVQAGTDATEAFVRSGHARATLQTMPVVGRLADR